MNASAGWLLYAQPSSIATGAAQFAPTKTALPAAVQCVTIGLARASDPPVSTSPYAADGCA